MKTLYHVWKYRQVAIKLVGWFLLAKAATRDGKITDKEWSQLQQGLYKIVIEAQEIS